MIIPHACQRNWKWIGGAGRLAWQHTEMKWGQNLKGVHRIFPFAVCFSSGIQPLPYLSHFLYRNVLHNACCLSGHLDLAYKTLSFSSSVVWLTQGVSLYVCKYKRVHIMWRRLKENVVKMGRETDLREWECETEAAKWQLEHNNSRTCFSYNPASLIWDFFHFKRVVYFNVEHSFYFLQ